MENCEPTVFIVDDDKGVQQSLRLLLESVNLKTQIFGNAQEFLDAYDPCQPGCLVLDVRMPGMSGMELHSKLKADQMHIPVIIITGHGDIEMAVQALHKKAVTFIEKPFRDQVLLDNIHKAINIDAEDRRKRAKQEDIKAKMATLTDRERQVSDLLVDGKSNKAIGYELKISHKTVDFHRINILEKMGVDSVVKLAKLSQILA